MIKYTPQIIPVGWDKVLDIGAGRQVFWDDYLVDTRQTTAKLTINHPTKLEPPFEFDAPWEGNWLSYGNICKIGDTYRLYYITGMAACSG